MSGNSWILPAIASVIVFLIYMVMIRVASKQETVRDRVQRIIGATDDNLLKENADNADPLRMQHDFSAFGLMLNGLLQTMGIDTEAFRKDSQMRFYRAGLISPDAPVYYLFYKRVGMWVLLLIALLLISSNPGWLDYFGAILLAVVALFGADSLLKHLRSKREKILQRSFPDALDLLLVCVESGLALDGALARVCKELGRARPEITQELNRTRVELTLLNDRVQALSNLAERTDMISFRSLVTTLTQSERFGTSLTDTLRVLSEDYRNTRLMLAENKAGRLPVLITIPLMLLMMPALFLVILGPAILQTLEIVHSQF